MNDEVLSMLYISEADVERVAAREQAELERRERAYRGVRPAPRVRGRVAILVDDGVATGSTIRAAIAALRRQEPARIVAAIPVAPPDVCEMLRHEADEVICLLTPEPFGAISIWYDSFPQLSDDDVRALLHRVGGERKVG